MEGNNEIIVIQDDDANSERQATRKNNGGGDNTNNIKTDDSKNDEEDNLLENVGVSVAAVHEYESNVLREATLGDAPKLSGVSFPTNSLESLLPSYDIRSRNNSNIASTSTSDIPHVKSVLSSVRAEIQKNIRNNSSSNNDNGNNILDKLYLKEQLLLCTLKRLLPKDVDFPVNRTQEFFAEQKRSEQLTNPESKVNVAVPKGRRDQQQQHRRVSFVTGTKSLGNYDENNFSTVSASQRLEQIKAGQSNGGLRKRVSIMERKRRESHGNDRLDDGDSEDKIEREKLKELIRQRRKERQERKRQRRERWEKQDNHEESGDEEEMEFEDNENKKNDTVVRVSSESEGTDNFDNGNGDHIVPDGTDTISAAAKETVLCPICNNSISLKGGSVSDIDSFLSKHMDECQKQHAGGRRRTRRTHLKVDYSEKETQSYGDEYDGGGGKINSSSKKKSNNTVAIKPTARPAETTKKRKRLSSSSSKTKRRQFYSRINNNPPVDDMDEEDYEDRVDQWIENGLEQMADMNERDVNEVLPGTEFYNNGAYIIPAWVNDRLFSYQRIALRWMYELHRQNTGGVIGDEMGLGKTVQVCSFLGCMAACRRLNSILIISPATMLQHWLSELKKWSPGLRRILIHSSGEGGSDSMSRNISFLLLRKLDKWLKKCRRDRVNESIDDEDYHDTDEKNFVGTGYVIVTTYENIRRQPDIWTSHNWSYVVCDEGQKIRNPDADVTMSVKRLRTSHRLLLSGTPIQNDLRELWSLFDFVFPGRLGTLPAFETEFADPIKRGGYSNASPTLVQIAYRCALVLRDLINPYMLRRQKKDIKEVSRMPGKTEQVLFCRLSDRQRALYEAYLRSDDVTNLFRGTSPQLLRAVTVLRKICNHPDLVCDADQKSFDNFVRNGCIKQSELYASEDDDDDDISLDDTGSMVERSGKLEILSKILPLWKKQGHRVLIFCQWKKMLNIIQRFAHLQGWKFGRMDGNTNVGSRQKMVDNFNNDDSIFLLLMTTRTGGVGLNLTGASRIIIYDPDWNPQTDAQARERAYRFGQKNRVTIYRLISAGTIEEKIYQRQIFKTAISNKILQDPRQRRLFSQKDLRDLFTLKADVGSVAKGGEGLTETGELTKGKGVVEPDSDERASSSSLNDNSNTQENKDTLESVMKSKGLAGIFDHDFVDEPSQNKRKSTSVLEIEAEAKRVAREAARALEESTNRQNGFEPTWTGTSETEPRRFGGVKRASSSNNKSFSSNELLSNLRRRENQVKNASNSVVSQVTANGEANHFAEILGRLRTFLFRQPTTEEILKEFDDIPTKDAAVFKRLLNSVAKVQNGKWCLK